jgi:hypothetical protein
MEGGGVIDKINRIFAFFARQHVAKNMIVGG